MWCLFCICMWVTLYNEGMGCLCCAGMGRVSANQCKVALNYYFYPLMKHFCPGGSGWVPERFDENDVNHVLWPLQSPDLNQTSEC